MPRRAWSSGAPPAAVVVRCAAAPPVAAAPAAVPAVRPERSRRSRRSRRHPGCLRSRRRSRSSWSQVEEAASSRVRPDAGAGDRWRTRPAGRRPEGPARPRRLADRPRREDRRRRVVAGPGAVPPGRDGDGHPVGVRRHAAGARHRAQLRHRGRLARGRGPRAAGELRHRVRRERGRRGGSRSRVRRSSPSWVTSTTARRSCWTRSARPTWSPARPVASPRPSAPTRWRPRSTATSARSPSSTPRVTRRSPPCVPVARSRPTSPCWWWRPTTV